MLPVTLSADSVPTEVMLVCAAVRIVPNKLPPVMLPVTLSADSVPTEVMLGCAAVVTVPAVVAEPDTVMVYVPLSRAAFSVPDEMLVALILLTLAPDPFNVPMKLPDVVLPVTATLVSVPTEVMLGCAAVVTVAAVVAAPVSAPTNVVDVTLVNPATVVTVAPSVSAVDPNVTAALARRACANVPLLMLVALILETLAPDPLSVPMKLPDVVLPVTAREVNVPTEVMLGCAAVVTVPAVVAAPVSAPTNVVDVTLVNPAMVVVVVPSVSAVDPSVTAELARRACANVPLEMLVALILETLAPDPFSVPTKLPLVVLPVTANELSVPTEVMLGCAAVVTVPAVVAAPVNAPTNVVDVTLVNPAMVVVVVPRASVVLPKTTLALANLACATVPVSKLLALSDVNARPLPNKLPPVMLPVADINPPVIKLPPVTLPVTLTAPGTFTPVLVKTAVLAIPATLTATLLLAYTLTLLLPSVIELALRLLI
jgi:hypothetical protein